MEMPDDLLTEIRVSRLCSKFTTVGSYHGSARPVF